ncbi:hypothetical protein Vadar_001332 [Vaccinium darrowii]|uniref:Uncharacterized protein n=1 Tax=Vaccinium darrowii TaxID=229202 RepID=A0ACB7X6R3_9ERIC|nr:hypothetical protein Vadar_001332 [Vaccinium darrowii]
MKLKHEQTSQKRKMEYQFQMEGGAIDDSKFMEVHLLCFSPNFFCQVKDDRSTVCCQYLTSQIICPSCQNHTSLGREKGKETGGKKGNSTKRKSKDILHVQL